MYVRYSDKLGAIEMDRNTKRNDNTLEVVESSKRPKILLLGNGINRSFGEGAWGDLLNEISCTSFDGDKESIRNIPFPLQAMVLTGDNVDEGIDMIADKLAKENINDEYADVLQKYAELSFDAILTANYTYDVEKALMRNFECKPKARCRHRKNTFDGSKSESQFGLFQYMDIENADGKYSIWHIHGEAGRPNSMVLGHYYYGKLLGSIQNYLSTFMRRYKGLMKHYGEFKPLSWVDYFMIADIYIVGLGLDPSELDLWWLINCKKRHSKELSSGKIYWFEPNLKEKKAFARRILAETNDIEMVHDTVKGNGYKKYYMELPEVIKTYL